MNHRLLTYRELICLPTFEERYEYLRQGAIVGESTFGFNRYLNQSFYQSRDWRRIRDSVIVRDNGCDLAHPDFPVGDQPVYIHHLNPISEDDILGQTDLLLNPEYLILTTFQTHNAIHYGDASLLPKNYVPREPNDTRLW